jgi:hypothetical protein
MLTSFWEEVDLQGMVRQAVAEAVRSAAKPW